MSLKYTLERFRWLKVLNSPFKPFKIKLYAGKTQVGIPYFLPRKWVKYTDEDAIKASVEHKANKNKVQMDDVQLFKMYKNYNKAVPLKVGFSYCGLGWKTKWTSTDFRHEWNPIISFVFFGYQIALTFYSPYHSHYWESWLCYEYASDKKKSIKSRLAFCRRKCPQTWTSHKHNEEPVTTDYWDLILKPKYLNNGKKKKTNT
jgi:hypothetical protein